MTEVQKVEYRNYWNYYISHPQLQSRFSIIPKCNTEVIYFNRFQIKINYIMLTCSSPTLLAISLSPNCNLIHSSKPLVFFSKQLYPVFYR